MDGGNGQRVAIKVCSKAGLSATETLVLVQKTYGNEALNRWNVFRGYSRFRDGRELVENDERGGRPKLTKKKKKKSCCCWFGQKWPSNRIKNDSRIFQHPQECSWDSERGFGKEKKCMHILSHTPWHLSKGKIESHLAKTLSQWLMQTIFFNKIITGDETWCFAYDPETKRRSSD
jgi:hypothetical protein